MTVPAPEPEDGHPGEQRPRLIFTGNVIVDVVLAIDHVPEPGGETIATSSQLTAGGGYNVMVAARRDGLDVLFAGRYGTGPFGDIVQTALADGGFAVAHDRAPDADSGYCVVLVDDRAERTFVTTVGAEGALTGDDLDRVRSRVGDLVYISGYSLSRPVTAAGLTGWLAGLDPAVRVFTDPSPLIGELEPDVLAAVLARTDVLTLNAREAGIATGRRHPAAAGGMLLERIRSDGLVVVRDGAAGCWLAGCSTPGQITGPVQIPGFAVDAVDTTGAGDAHAGVLAAGLARGDAPTSAARRANAAAALAVTRRGPATAPDADQIDSFLAATH